MGDVGFLFLAWYIFSALYLFFSSVNLYGFFEGFGFIICKNKTTKRQISHRNYMKNSKKQIRWEINVHFHVALGFLSFAVFSGKLLDPVVFFFILIWFQLLKSFFVQQL